MMHRMVVHGSCQERKSFVIESFRNARARQKKKRRKFGSQCQFFHEGGNFSRAEIKLVQRKSRLEASHKNNSSADRN